MESVIGQRLGGDGQRACFGSTDSGDALLVGQVLPIGFRNDQNADRAVLLRVQDFHASRGVARVAGAVENGVGIGFLRFVVENQHDFSVRVDALVGLGVPTSPSTFPLASLSYDSIVA